ncbi:MAG: hypothetical protein RBT70_07715 [Alphaproteobacteria bacterium]|jgi:hypothetical protein|nr:hypothetical protein [Alphaproteobacteria bacterium]
MKTKNTHAALQSMMLPLLTLMLVLVAATPSEAAKRHTSSPVVHSENAAKVAAILLEPSELDLAGAIEVADADMGDVRGGFIDPTGMIFRFAVDIKSQIDGALMFVRSLVLQHTDSIHDSVQQAVNESLPKSQGNSGFVASSSSEVIQENIPHGTEVKVMENGSGLVISNSQGQTTFINQTSAGAFSNVIMNTADNRIITQTMNIDLVLQNMTNVINNVADIRSRLAPAGLGQIAHMHTIGFGL